MKNSAIHFLCETVRKFPEKTCIFDEKGKLDFRRFFLKASSTAEVLSRDLKKNRPILIFLPKSTSAVVSFAASLLSGNFYVPVDINSPVPRLKKIIGNLMPWRIISSLRYLEQLKELRIQKEKIFFIEDTPPYKEDQSIDSLIAESCQRIDKIIDLDPCYVMYTSGSTSVPKGVVTCHRGVLDYINWAVSFFKVDENEVIANQAPLCFDNSTLDIYLSWATGAALHLVPERYFIFPADLIEYLEKHRATFIFFVPSILVNISRLKLLNNHRLPSLKKIIFAGETMPTQHLAYWQKKLPGRIFVNLYGPTEITVDCTYLVVKRIYKAQEILPIGFPRSNMEILILDELGHPVKKGEKGELCVRGSSLALGYWNDEEKTKVVFAQNPNQRNYLDSIYRTGDIGYRNKRGEIIFVGRKDFQIKHLGYRIEPGEIEAAAKSVPGMDNCCVLYNQKKQEITLFYEGEREIKAEEFRRLLHEKIPDYMIPRKIVRLDSLPLSPSGKIDRNSLSHEFF